MRVYTPPEPEFPQLTVILHANCLYIGRPTLVTYNVGEGVSNTRSHMSPCWSYRGRSSPAVDTVIDIAKGLPGFVNSAPFDWYRCDGLSLETGIQASMPVNEDGIAELRRIQPFGTWIDAEDARLAERHKAAP